MNLQEQLQALVNELKTLVEKESWTAEDEARHDELKGQIDAKKGEVERRNKQVAAQSGVADLTDYLCKPVTMLAHNGNPGNKDTAPAVARRTGKLKNFKGAGADERAHRFGQWFLAGPCGNVNARNFCQTAGIEVRAHTEGVNADGGFLVPTEFDSDLIDLRETYGVFRANAYVKRMASDSLSTPRRTGGLTAYPIGEGVAITESKKGWDRVMLVAKKWGVLAKYSSELNEDSVLDMADDLAGEIAYAFANKEDECGFNGDGTSTYHRITGVLPKLKGLNSTIANIAGLVVGTGNAWSELTLADFAKVKGRLPEYAHKRNAKWFASLVFYTEVMETLALAAGGNTAREIMNGAGELRYLGYPVVVSQVMPRVEANSQVACVFGDLGLAAVFGDRRVTTIALSEHNDFEQDEIAIRGTERFDINVHDVGNASATASARVPGPIVGLITAAS